MAGLGPSVVKLKTSLVLSRCLSHCEMSLSVHCFGICPSVECIQLLSMPTSSGQCSFAMVCIHMSSWAWALWLFLTFQRRSKTCFCTVSSTGMALLSDCHHLQRFLCTSWLADWPTPWPKKICHLILAITLLFLYRFLNNFMPLETGMNTL